jgi:atypical dual specificity phosphatase
MTLYINTFIDGPRDTSTVFGLFSHVHEKRALKTQDFDVIKILDEHQRDAIRKNIDLNQYKSIVIFSDSTVLLTMFKHQYPSINISLISHDEMCTNGYIVSTLERSSSPVFSSHSKIIQNLYISNADDAISENILTTLNIKTVINCTKTEPFTELDNIYKFRVPISDDFSPIYQYFDNAIDIIHSSIQADNPVLVHCFAGISRSVTIVCAYLMKYHKMNRDHAIEFIKLNRPQACPNISFYLQLGSFEKIINSV